MRPECCQPCKKQGLEALFVKKRYEIRGAANNSAAEFMMFLMQKSEFLGQLLEENDEFSIAAPYELQCFPYGAGKNDQALPGPPAGGARKLQHW